MLAKRNTLPAAALAWALAGCAAAPDPPAAHRLACEDGRVFAVIFDAATDRAILTAGDERRTLAHLPSGSGARYGDAEVELWTKGNEATLARGDTRLACRFEGGAQ